jgi:hypothetical protein
MDSHFKSVNRFHSIGIGQIEIGHNRRVRGADSPEDVRLGQCVGIEYGRLSFSSILLSISI